MPEIPLISHLTEPVRKFLEIMKESGENRSVPNISWTTAAEIQKHIQKYPVKNILEIGPANGFSTLMMHIEVPEAHITSIEFSRHAFEELRQNLQTFIALRN